MPQTYAETYWPVLLQALIAMAVAAGMVGISYILGNKVRNRVKDMPYECGITPTGSARERFSVKFYLVGMLFILFDIEAIFLYPVGGGVPGTEDVRVFRDVGVHRPGPGGIFLHLEKRRAGLVRRRPAAETVTESHAS
jgi:NADH:ubiquinone oxidoreductase subunit 3 (subunit A)